MNINSYRRTGLFFGLSTLISWVFWIIASYTSWVLPAGTVSTYWISIIAFMGLLSPALTTLFLTRGDKEAVRDIKGRFFNFKGASYSHIILAFLLMPLSILLAQAVSLLFGYSIGQFQLAGSFSFSSGVFPVWFMFIIAPILEELAWHTYGTDSLRRRYNLFTTSLLFALFWGIWHIPYLYINDYYNSNLAEEGWIYSLNFWVSLFPFIMIMNWIYYKTNSNIILPIVFHIAARFFNEIFDTHPMSKVTQTCLLVLYTCYIVINDKDFFFAKEPKVFRQKNSAFPRLINIRVCVAFFVFSMLSLGATTKLLAQDIKRNITGKVYDEISQEPLPFATIVLKSTDPPTVTTSDVNGHFVLEDVKVGRHTISTSMIGYDTYEIKEFLVSSGSVLSLNVGLQPSNKELDEVVVRVSKSTPLNSMATLSSRQFTVEETQRYAGGMDDPARLATSFAGVANPSFSNNGISVRGNNPDGLLWRIEGVEVPSPNHFANLSVAGGGLLSAISSQVMSNSDFYTGAFPAEYGNAFSGVFDINLREGNRYKRQYSFKAGVLGIEALAQGPLHKNTAATYIVNYRNSTMAVLAPILPKDAGILKYQDITFKSTFPTKKYGKFTLWGIGTIDGVDNYAEDSTNWESDFQRDNSKTAMYMYATALSHGILLPGDAFLKTSLSLTGSGLNFSEERLDYTLKAHPQSKAVNNTSSVTFQSEVSTSFNDKHTNKTGIRYTHNFFALDVEQSPANGTSPIQVTNQTGNTGFMQIFSQSKINLTPRLELNAGINAQYLMLNKALSIEPRAGIKYLLNDKQSLGYAYGMHSRMEQLSVYYATVNGGTPNTGLDLAKSSHHVFSYQAKITDDLHLSIEPYYQHLHHVPVASSGYISTLNNRNNIFFNKALVSKGRGRNIGIDLTLEKYLSEGYYYMLTAAVFDSKYTGADGLTRNTLFNKNYIFNLLAGNEWQVRKNNIFSTNIRLNYLGGNRVEPIDLDASMHRQEVIYGETEENVAFEKKHEDLPVLSLTLSYRVNRAKFSSLWSLQVLNVTGTKEYSGDFYNLKTNTVEAKFNRLLIPNISYKIEF
ncbi:carboxypeptidase-like regulatory domain-containing protein [Pontibacter korlensis]|nr:carboxypeptidase-like regulatory domain-containing protein [Pontibacter korlensis]